MQAKALTDDRRAQYNNLAPEEHKAKLSHELIGGAAAFEVRAISVPKLPDTDEIILLGYEGL